ncbi:MAG: ATP-binding cassette domain-containing protein [Myxococcota bacterium]
MSRRLPFFAPEVVQTSMMDCGPASLKSLLDGLGSSVSYGRLREACRTDVDGTSIDDLEAVGCALGVPLEQVMQPFDHLCLPEAEALPALAVVALPGGVNHFVVVWRRVGRFVQVMDPAEGRRWMTIDELERNLYLHTMPVPLDAVRDWLEGDEFRGCLFRRARTLGINQATFEPLHREAMSRPTIAGIGRLDGALRLVDKLCHARALRRGRTAATALATIFSDHAVVIPHQCFSVITDAEDTLPGEQILGVPAAWLRGAVLVRRITAKELAEYEESEEEEEDDDDDEAPPQAVAGEQPLIDASGQVDQDAARARFAEPEHGPWRWIGSMLVSSGGLVVAFAMVATALGAFSTLVQGLLFRALLTIEPFLALPWQRVAAPALAAVLFAGLWGLDVRTRSLTLRFGRRLEHRFRVALREKIGRLPDTHFRSRLSSDMAYRAHLISTLRAVPHLLGTFVEVFAGLVAIVIGLYWLSPQTWPWAVGGSVATIVVPLLFRSTMDERELRAQTQGGALTRVYLDALLGRTTLRAMNGETAILDEHEHLLALWRRALARYARIALSVEVLTAGLGTATAVACVWIYVESAVLGATGAGSAPGVLLVAYWSLQIPVFGQLLATAFRQLPPLRNTVARLIEPLTAPEEAEVFADADASESEPVHDPKAVAQGDSPRAAGAQGGIALSMQRVTVGRWDRPRLREITVDIAAGEQVAIVGLSGAGKSSFVAVLLGFLQTSAGRMLIDGLSVTKDRITSLRRRCAWIDPQVQLWEGTVLDNITYGHDSDAATPDRVVDATAGSGVAGVLTTFRDGMQTRVGRGGTLLSGGQGQRLRLARALVDPDKDLVILDEAFRGLEFEERRELLAAVRGRASARRQTLLCVTHDLRACDDFERVLVFADGAIVQDGDPKELAVSEGVFARMHEAAQKSASQWTRRGFRRVLLRDGQVCDEPQREAP